MKDLNINVMRIDTDADLRSVLGRLSARRQGDTHCCEMLEKVMRHTYRSTPIGIMLNYIEYRVAPSAFGRSCE